MKVVRLKELLEKECKEDIVKVLVGNKIDLRLKRQFPTFDGHALAKECGMDRYVEMSALHNIEIASPINHALMQI